MRKRPERAPWRHPGSAGVLLAAALCVVVPGAAGPGVAQALPSGPGGPEGHRPGAVEAGLLLRQLGGVKRVLVIGAHPDDEDTSLLAALARGWGARAAYLSLTRGEGGQNLIGPELGEGLGLLRTGELLAARRVDGAEQYFTRAYDFGYSKTAEETFHHWPRDSLLADVVWVVRRFRPQVVVSVFSGTPRDGHGQHQVAGILAREAFEAAGDPGRFPEQLESGVEPWRPLKLYRRTWRDPEASTLVFDTGVLDPLLGRSWHQVAMRSRSQHRSQDFGTAETAGPRVTRLGLLESRVSGPDTSLFAGIDTTLGSLAEPLPPERRRAVRTALERYREAVRAASGRLSALEPWKAVPPLARALERLEAARRAAGPEGAVTGAAGGRDGGGSTGSRRGGSERGGAAGDAGAGALVRELERQRDLAEGALLAAAGVAFQLRGDDDLLVPGQRLAVVAEAWNGGPYALTPEAPVLRAPAGWSVTAGEGPRDATPGDPYDEIVSGEARGETAAAATLPPGVLRRWTFEVRVPADAAVSEPYFLRRDRNDDLYRWPSDPALRTLPGDPPLLTGELRLTLAPEATGGGEPAPPPLDVSVPVRYRGVDKAAGEYWRPLLVVPALSVGLEPRALVWPAGASGARALTATLRAQADGLEGETRLETPAGWRAEPGSRGFELERASAVRSLGFEVRPREGASAGGEGRDPSASEEGRDPSASEEGRDPSAGGEGMARGAQDEVVRAGARLDGAGAGARRYDRELLLVDYPHIDPIVHLRPAETVVRRIPLRVTDGRRVGYVTGAADEDPQAIRQLGLPVESLGPGDVEAGAFEGYDVIVLGARAYEVRPELAAANGRLLDWVRSGGTLIVQYNKYEFVEGAFAPYPLCIDRPHDRVTDETAPVELLEESAPIFRYPNDIGPDDFRGWVQERGLYFAGDWDPRYTPLMAMADPGEEARRGALLVAEVGEGLYVYTGLAFFRQLPEGVPGAYRLFANLLSLEPDAWRAWRTSHPRPAASAPPGGPEVECHDRWR